LNEKKYKAIISYPIYLSMQVGTGQIADNAVTTPKIADNSITSTKPNEAFMKRKTLLDSPAGNALGWNPDGVTKTFTITEPDVSGLDTGYVSALVEFAGLPNCQVDSQLTGSFSLICENPPGDSTRLHYVVENLPAHVVQ
jgi:hypothetical protein